METALGKLLLVMCVIVLENSRINSQPNTNREVSPEAVWKYPLAQLQIELEVTERII